MRLFIFFLLFSFFECASEKKIIISSTEMKKAFDSKKVSEMNKLKRIMREENRKLRSYALALTRKYITYLNQLKPPTPEQTIFLKEINILLSNIFKQEKNFNIKNLALWAIAKNSSQSYQMLENILNENLNNQNTHLEVVNFSLKLSAELYEKKKIETIFLAQKCQKYLKNTKNEKIFLNALNCYHQSPLYNSNEIKALISSEKDLFKKISLIKSISK